MERFRDSRMNPFTMIGRRPLLTNSTKMDAGSRRFSVTLWHEPTKVLFARMRARSRTATQIETVKLATETDNAIIEMISGGVIHRKLCEFQSTRNHKPDYHCSSM